MTTPDDGLRIEERSVVRVVVLDPQERVLLFAAQEITLPEYGTWWELPGGGIEPGETYVEAAIRELFEETGISVTADQLSAPNWRRTGTFRFRGARRVQHEVVVTARLDAPADVDVSGQLPYELEDYTSSRWWPVAEVCASTEKFYPSRLPTLLRAHLRGEAIDEPLDLFN
jgi:8-oxo-dGTP pyrophosphatase MutT (NUDIX family)